MTDQQNKISQLPSEAEPTAAKTSQSVLGNSQRIAEHGNPNRDIESKAHSDKLAKRQKNLRL